MEYTIGEVSALLNTSRDMIRYYEKHGAIKASRNTSNNYRTYDAMEIFWLLEAIQHKSWGLPISEISALRKESYISNTGKFLRERVAELQETAEYNRLLADRLQNMGKEMMLSRKNIGNFWVEMSPADYRWHLVTGHGDLYDRINLSQEVSRFVFSDLCLPFFDSCLTVKDGCVEWEMAFQEAYLEALHAKIPEGFRYVPEEMTLCTNVDIGEIGSFDLSAFRVIEEYARNHGYTVCGDTRGKLLGRGYEKEHFHRIVKLYLPIRE